MFLAICVLIVSFYVASAKIFKLKHTHKLQIMELEEELKRTAYKVSLLEDLKAVNDQIIKEQNKLLECLRVQKLPFSPEQLKRMQFYLHPDKHNGKSEDVFITVRDLYNFVKSNQEGK